MSNSDSQNSNNLPNFMNEKTIVNYNEESDVNNSWLNNNLHKLMIWVSAVWFGIVLIYITQFFGWSNLFLMMPDEFGGFLAGVTLPLAIIWVVMAYIDRGASFKQEAKFLRAYMNQLVYPEDGGANTAKAMADAIRSQVIELQEVTKLATQQTEKIKVELGDRVEDFSKLVKVLDNYSSQTIVELTQGVKTLVQSFDHVTQKADASSQSFKGLIVEFSKNSQDMQNNITSLFNGLLPRIQEIKTSSALLQNISDDNNNKMHQSNELLSNFSEKSNKTMLRVSDLLTNQTARLEEVSRNAVDSCSSIYSELDGGIANLDKLLNSQTSLVAKHIGSLENKTDSLSQKFVQQGEILGVEVDKILVRANVIEETISLQVNELTNVADDITNTLKTVEDTIKDQVSTLETQSLKANANLNDCVENLSENAQKLVIISDTTLQKNIELSEDIDNKNSQLEKISETIKYNIMSLAQKLEEQTSSLQKQAQIAASQFTDTGISMKKYADNLIETSSIVVSQSKVSEASLAQQQRSINASIIKVDEVKAELKRQIDELTRSASIIDDEATSATIKLKKQMESTLEHCDTVVAKTKLINANLVEQSLQFDNSTNKTLTKVTQLEAVLENKATHLENVSVAVLERSKEVEAILEKQTTAVDKSTESSASTFNELHNAFETQSGLLNSVAENTIGYVSDVVQALDDKAEAINLLFKYQENVFFDVCDKLNENTINIGSTLKKQVSHIEQSADRVFSRMTMLEEDVNKRAEVVVENSARSIDKLAEINKYVSEQNIEVNGYMTSISEKIKAVSNNFRSDIQDFTNSVRDIQTESSNAAGTILANAKRISDANQDMKTDVKNITTIVDGQIKSLDVSLIKTKSQADGIKETFETQKDAITDVVNVLTTQTRLGEASLAQQYKYLSDASTEVSTKLNDINIKFKENTDNALDSSVRIAYEFNVLGDRLLKTIDDIEKASKTSVKTVDKFNISLAQSSEDLELTINNSVAKVGLVLKDYDTYIANFNTVTAEASTGVVEINTLISDQSDKMIKISEDTKQLVECFNTVLNSTSLELSNRANFAYDKVKGLGENLKLLSNQIEESTKMSVKHFDTSGDKLRATIGEVSANAERISNDIRSSGEVFLKQSEVLVATTDDTLNKVDHVINDLNISAGEFSSKSNDILKQAIGFNEVVNKQVEALTQTSGKVDKKLSQLQNNYDDIKIDSFLKDASYIIEKLETVSVDINRIFNPNAEEELWKKYYNGDSSAFVRYLSKTMTKQQVVAIRNQFEQNLEFRNLVTKYLTEFETLITKAKNNERSGILLSVVTGADIGKVYYILARALDKIN